MKPEILLKEAYKLETIRKMDQINGDKELIFKEQVIFAIQYLIQNMGFKGPCSKDEVLIYANFIEKIIEAFGPCELYKDWDYIKFLHNLGGDE